MLVEIRNELQRYYVSIYRQEQEHLDKSLLLSKLVSVIYCLIKIPSGRQVKMQPEKNVLSFAAGKRLPKKKGNDKKKERRKTKSNSKRTNNQ